MMIAFLIRHGRTAINAAGLLRGHLDKPLDPVGEREADALGELFAAVPLQQVFTSPLGRARQTAEAIVRRNRAPLTIADRLMDRDYGCWTGHPKSAVEARYGSLESAPEVEPWRSFQQWIHAAFEQISLWRGAPARRRAQAQRAARAASAARGAATPGARA